MLEQDVTASRVSISILVILRLLPSIVIGPVGGVLADRYDRKLVMVSLDVLGAVIALFYLISFWLQSIPILYICTVLQQCVTGLYEPSRSAIVPMLVSETYLPKATTLTVLVWSTMTAIGAFLSGMVVDTLGIPACFWIDSATYLASGCLLACATGRYSATDGLEEKKKVKILVEDSSSTEESFSDGEEFPSSKLEVRLKEDSSSRHRSTSSMQMIFDAYHHLISSPHGPTVLIKGCGALLFGSSDVITVVFAERDGVLDSKRLGWMFAAVGIGCLLGPAILDHTWKAHSSGALHAWRWASSVSYGVIGIGYFMVGFHDRYWLKCAWNAFRASGSSVLWIDSSLMLQTTMPQELLGRVMAIDLALATAGEAVSAIAGGIILDRGLLSADGLAVFLGGVGLLLCLIWLLYSLWLTRSRGDERDKKIELKPLNSDQPMV